MSERAAGTAKPGECTSPGCHRGRKLGGAWGWVWTIRGTLPAVPMMMVLNAICDHVEDFKGVGEFLGD